MTRLNWSKARSNPRGYSAASPRGAAPVPMRGGSHVKPGKVKHTTHTTNSTQDTGGSMGSSVNKVILVGRVGQDPEVRFTGSGQAVCNFSVATDEEWKDKAGEKQRRTEWSRIVVWGKQAELCGEYLKKGRQCYVEGKLQTSEYEKDGQKRYTTEVIASQVTFLGGREGGSGRSTPQDDSGDLPY